MTKNNAPVRFTGQHFTTDTALIKEAIRLAALKKTDRVLDIGAGTGLLTEQLANYSDNIIAIENDPALVAQLNAKFRFNRKIRVVEADFMRYKIPGSTFKVVSNIPYASTSAILKQLMYAHGDSFAGGCIVMQLEPARKLLRKQLYNPYVAFYQTFFGFDLVREVAPSSFTPPPKVKSALVKIDNRDTPCPPPEMKVKYLHFLFLLLRFPELPARTALKKLFRKRQVRAMTQKQAIHPDTAVKDLSTEQLYRCFVEMTRLVPSKNHPRGI